ncbi:serine incorporator [Tripterygium wilfordii]|uniref:Serine incorporator n=2 Tax=Tripterygium wilfordii TaxID=458696 RepID=A0A7J7CRE8_TRIWF|nr:probable serine incorporator isoform X2 [Tripterygium wilfordii]XP_038723471.1 probable serine incorporator isoform X2 [Tripterygium wilfordii]XP_038723472.1 probable serine incorporator isoform X2 [Tripterygium wilfordii]KAF5736677.1 serine incorporator [Tripterygium wilfordii]
MSALLVRHINAEAVPGSLEQNRVDWSQAEKKSLRARYYYGIVFLLTSLFAWVFRDYAQRVLPQLQYLQSCGAEGIECFGTLGVLRVSLGCFIFFFIMLLTTIGTSKLYEARNNWHSRWWTVKFFLLILSLAVPFFFPSDYIQLYGEFARVGAGIFLLLQLVSVIEFVAWWDDYWMPDESKKQKYSCSLGLFTSTLFYIASVCGIVAIYFFYVPKPSCALNIFFISWTAVLLTVMMSISLYSKVNRGLLSSGIMASYIVYLCWSAIRSEPASETCNRQHKVDGHTDWSTVLGFLIALGAIVMATFSTGIDSKSFQFCRDKVKLEDDIPYKYGLFHLIFSLGAMYCAMLFISWNLRDSARKWSIDVGWASTWVKIVSGWFAASIYIWKLIFPVVRQNKVMDVEVSVEQRVTT